MALCASPIPDKNTTYQPDDSDHDSDEETFPYFVNPKVNRNRMLIEDVKALHSRCAASAYSPDYHLTKHFLKYPLIKYTDVVVDGFVRETESNLLIPADIVSVCRAYFVHSEDKAFQLAYKIYSILRALKKPAAQIKVFYIVIAKYLKEKEPAKLKQHFDELKRLRYIQSVDDNGKLYEISMASKVCFQTMAMS